MRATNDAQVRIAFILQSPGLCVGQNIDIIRAWILPSYRAMMWVEMLAVLNNGLVRSVVSISGYVKKENRGVFR